MGVLYERREMSNLLGRFAIALAPQNGLEAAQQGDELRIAGRGSRCRC